MMEPIPSGDTSASVVTVPEVQPTVEMEIGERVVATAERGRPQSVAPAHRTEAQRGDNIQWQSCNITVEWRQGVAGQREHEQCADQHNWEGQMEQIKA